MQILGRAMYMGGFYWTLMVHIEHIDRVKGRRMRGELNFSYVICILRF